MHFLAVTVGTRLIIFEDYITKYDKYLGTSFGKQVGNWFRTGIFKIKEIKSWGPNKGLNCFGGLDLVLNGQGFHLFSNRLP